MRLAEIIPAFCDHANRRLLRLATPRDFAIVSNNCWGAGFYRDLDREYNTPFVGTLVPPECYLRLLAGFPQSLDQPLRFIAKSRYTSWEIRCPVAELGGSEIHFMHYGSQSEASEKWRRRLDRFPRNPADWRFKFCDHHAGAPAVAEEQMRRFDALPFAHKVCFLGRRAPLPSCGIFIRNAEGRVMDGHALYRISLRHFNAPAWLSGAPAAASRVPGICL